MNAHHQPVEDILAAYRAAVFAGDADALIGLYHADACVFDAWDAWTYGGADEWRHAVGAWLGSLGEERVAVTFDRMRVNASETIAVVHAFARYAALSPQGIEVRALVNRLSWVIEQRFGKWRITHEHSSVPVDFASKRALLDPGPR